MAAAIRPDTKIVFLANPNNPTGTFLPWDAIRAFVSRVPARRSWCWTRPTASTCRRAALADGGLARGFPQPRRLANAFQGYGSPACAGLRARAPEVAELMNRVRQPFNVNHLAMVAACAALGDDAFIAESRRVNAEGLAQLGRGFARLGLEYIPSAGNFVAVRGAMPRASTRRSCARA